LQRSLAIPTKRYDKPLLGFLSRAEMEAVLAAPDRRTWSGERDFVVFSVAYNTGVRVSEMHLLQAGVDVNSIALWLGHVNPSTTHTYGEADLAMKERTLQKLAPTSARSRRFHADDRLLAFLNGLYLCGQLEALRPLLTCRDGPRSRTIRGVQHP
jgi:integrase